MTTCRKEFDMEVARLRQVLSGSFCAMSTMACDKLPPDPLLRSKVTIASSGNNEIDDATATNTADRISATSAVRNDQTSSNKSRAKTRVPGEKLPDESTIVANVKNRWASNCDPVNPAHRLVSLRRSMKFPTSE